MQGVSGEGKGLEVRVSVWITCTRGSGVLPKGQHSWNISVMKEAKMDPKVVFESSAKCSFRRIFFCPQNFF